MDFPLRNFPVIRVTRETHEASASIARRIALAGQRWRGRALALPQNDRREAPSYALLLSQHVLEF